MQQFAPIASVAPFQVLPKSTPEEVRAVVQSIRPTDREELAAWGATPSNLLNYHNHDINLPMWTAFKGRAPVFIVGLVRTHADTFTLIGFGTPEVKSVMKSLSVWAQDEFLPEAFDCIRAKRIEARVPLSSDKSWRWLMSMGMKVETRLGNFGKGGEEFVQLSYTSYDYEKDYE